MRTHTHTFARARAHSCTGAHAHTRTRAHAHTCARTRARTHARTRAHAHALAHTRTYAHDAQDVTVLRVFLQSCPSHLRAPLPVVAFTLRRYPETSGGPYTLHTVYLATAGFCCCLPSALLAALHCVTCYMCRQYNNQRTDWRSLAAHPSEITPPRCGSLNE